jgi:hypothetical protein
MGLSANVGRTETDFQWDLRIVNGLLLRWRDLAAGLGIRTNGTAKGQREAGL